ncbi:MAG: methionyl-tRNA formyltransferase [Actinobacteria bacterium]|nr:methionyl-tRNA formyltransferase [Actinomycetota bacterium]
MKIVVAATPDVAIPTLDWLRSSDHQLISVITQPDRPAGRGRALKESVISEWARENNIPCSKPESVTETGSLIKSADVLLTIGYGVLLPEEILTIPAHGCLNLHFSLLPRWRGAAPVQRAIEAGDSVSGVTVFQLDPGMDTGPIYSMKRFALDADITSDELFSELGVLGVEAVSDALTAIMNGVRPEPQKSDGATRAQKISKEECEINWELDAATISQKIRAFTSVPGAWTRFRGETLKIDSIAISQVRFEAGSLHVLNKELFVGTSSDAISIGFLTPAGKSRMDAKSWLNGARVTDGEFFG